MYPDSTKLLASYISLYVDAGESEASGNSYGAHLGGREGDPRRVARALIHQVSLIASILFIIIIITINSDLLNPRPPTPPTAPTGHTVPYTPSPAASSSPSWNSAPSASPVSPSSSLLAGFANPLFLGGALRGFRSRAHCFRVTDCNSREEARVYYLALRYRYVQGFRSVGSDE